MGDKTSIEWTDSTWNPVSGCTKVSAGCTNCYAETMATRFAGTPSWPNGFAVTCHPERLEIPLRWRKGRRVFLCSAGDLLHAEVPDEFVDHVFLRMALARQHTFQVLTKRPERMRDWMAGARDRIVAAGLVACERGVNGWSKWAPRVARHSVWWREHFDRLVGWPLRNVWLGVTAENREQWDRRVSVLREVPAALRFVSYEPALGPLGDVDLAGIGWVIAGCESGPRRRPTEIGWLRSLRDQCAAAGVPFFLKQMDVDGRVVHGPALDGQEHREFPTAAGGVR